MELITAQLIATLPGLTEHALSALPDAPVVVERPRRFRLRPVAVPSVTVTRAPAAAAEPC